MNKNIALIISCEHAVNTVPEQYINHFTPFSELLNTHRGIDIGALEIAQYLKETVPCYLVQSTMTRLLVDCNRSINHPTFFSEITRALPPEAKSDLIDLYYTPYRNQVIDFIKRNTAEGLKVWHISIHSFTPVMNEIIRKTDIGLLYDPRRTEEKAVARHWKKEMAVLSPQLRIRMNYPYKGISDGFTKCLRKQFSANEYLGIQIELNQALTANDQTLNSLKHILSLSLLKIIC